VAWYRFQTLPFSLSFFTVQIIVAIIIIEPAIAIIAAIEWVDSFSEVITSGSFIAL